MPNLTVVVGLSWSFSVGSIEPWPRVRPPVEPVRGGRSRTPCHVDRGVEARITILAQRRASPREAPVVRLNEPCRGADGAHRPLPRRQGADHDRDPESASGRIGTFTTLVTLLGGTTVQTRPAVEEFSASDAGPAYTVLAPLPRVCSVLIGRSLSGGEMHEAHWPRCPSLRLRPRRALWWPLLSRASRRRRLRGVHRDLPAAG